MVAARKSMDPFGFIMLGTVTGIGGGTLRDLLIGATPLAWIFDPTVVIICAVVSIVAFFTAHQFEKESRARILLWADAVGLALFAVSGTARGFAAGAPAISAILLGVVTATFGGIIRDVMAGDVPLVLKRDIYVTAALAGAIVFALTSSVVPSPLPALFGFAVAFVARALAITHGLSLPQYGSRRDE
ncbi:trimeric intracellular cation channel family protein [Phreatobacter stygius]|uniref:Trimeric intracellular cation channel family protein n=2 Tax=Phreatobacter stygius TaxID=1940610 RepID=A0A4D7B7M7_9HYPH|nr:trimeric intracellular cation channel family protein [Phreatobacter stygius]